jgi:hypothetical protein
MLIGLVVGVALGAGIALIAKALNARLLSGLFSGYDAAGGWAWVLILLAMFGAILLHEIGHVVGGLSVGFRFMLLVVGPLRVEREPSGKLKVGLNKELASGGGLAALYPEDPHDLVRRFAWVVAAGPIASAVTCALWVAIVAILPDASIARSFIATLGGLSFAVALATLTPMQAGVYLTDGARLRQLHRGGPEARRDAAMLSLLAVSVGDAPFESWDRATVLASIEPVDGSIFELQGRSYAYGWLVAKGATSEAREQMQRAIDITAGLPPAMRAALDNELAFIDALHPPADGGGCSRHARAACHTRPARLRTEAHPGRDRRLARRPRRRARARGGGTATAHERQGWRDRGREMGARPPARGRGAPERGRPDRGARKRGATAHGAIAAGRGTSTAASTAPARPRARTCPRPSAETARSFPAPRSCTPP